MSRAITITVSPNTPETLSLELIPGGYTLDMAGLQFTSTVLRDMLMQVERGLIKLQMAQENVPNKETDNAID